MSRNFDILLREIPRAAPTVAPNAGETGTSAPRNPVGVIDDEIAKLARQMFLLHDDDKPAATAVTFCGVSRGDGSSWVCARASAALSEQFAGRVCVVDANFRSPSLHEHFRLENVPGLAEAMKSSAPVEEFAQQTWSSHLWFLSSGTVGRDPSSALNPGRLQELLSELRAEFDYVLVDAPALSSCGDGALLGQLTDGVVLVIGCNSTRRETARAAKENLEATGVSILGTVLNKRTFPIPEALYRRL
jgi:protein-tyrosine kinase